MRRDIPHKNLSGYPGSGKTTIIKRLLADYNALLLPKYTTRPQRPVEEIPEYIFVGDEEFDERNRMGQFIAIEKIERYGVTHRHAIPNPRLWPQPTPSTKLLISSFGLYANIAKQYAPAMELCFVDFKNVQILKQRLYERCKVDNSDFETKLKVIELYLSQNLAKQYERIIYNDGTIEETIAQLLG